MLFTTNRKDYHDRLLQLAYQVLCEIGDIADKVTLGGAYAIYSSYFGGIYSLSSSSRETSDLDIDLYMKVGDLDYTEFQQRYIRKVQSTFGLSSKVDFFALKTRDTSVTYSFKVYTEEFGTSGRLKIDFKETEGERLFSIAPLELSFIRKLSVSNTYVDRRPKDKIDVCSILVYFYTNGISKGEIVDLAQRYGFTFELNPSWYSRDAIDKGLYSLRNFKPSPSIPHLSNDTCLFWVQALLLGLFNPNIPSSAVFKEGVWY